MSYRTYTGMLTLAFAGCLMAAAQESKQSSGLARTPDGASSVLGFKDEAIARAVRETLAESKEMERETRREGTTSAAMEAKAALRGDKYDEFGRQFSEAQHPGCLGPNALKHQPTEIVTKTWVFSVGGIFILPLWARAVVTGKCR